MAQSKQGLTKVIDLTALQTKIATDDAHGHAADEVVQARQAMLNAMERGGAALIVEEIQALEEKIIAMTGYGVNPNPEVVEAYHHIVNIGRVALLELSPASYSSYVPVESIRRWDA